MKLLAMFTGAMLLSCTGANAMVLIDPHLSGTGDNVTFESFNGTNLAIGSFNGQHTGIVDFTDLSNNPAFTGSANGNDIKIANTNDLNIQVFTGIGGTVLNTSTQVFSLKGSGDVQAIVAATDGTFTFDLGTINDNAQSGFTLTAIDGESMSNLILLDLTGTITDYEHYRIDVAETAQTPLPASAWLLGAGLVGMAGLARRKRKTA